MPVSLADAHWLRGNGYQHLCFVSWATNSGNQIRDTALACKTEIERILAQSELPTSVFFDQATLPPGAQWESALAEAVCSSFCLIAFCCNSYYGSMYCGREFATMDYYGTARLGSNHRLIVPVRCWGAPIPSIIGRFQAIDISHNLGCPDRRFNSKTWFKVLVEKLAQAIDESAQQLALAKKSATCNAPTLLANPFPTVAAQVLPFQSP